MTNLKLLALLFLGAVITGCTGIGPRVIDLMPAPAAFADRLFNPLPKNPPPVPYDDFNVLYATDRKASENPAERPFYLNEAGFFLRLGSARVTAGQPGLSWKDIRRISLSTQRTGNYPMKIQSVDETGVLDKTYTLLTREPEDSVIADRIGDEFAARVDERLTESGVKEVYIYVHGFRVIFDDPVLIAAELWHFLGYRGAFIAYAWPSTPRATAYLSDLETAQTVARNLRLFLAYLSERTQVEKIHIVAFSAGSRLVVRALEQMALLNSDATDEQIRRNFRIGNLIIIGGDISRERFGAAVTDGMLRIPERTVVYVSSADIALAWARRIFRRRRLGEMWGGESPQRTEQFLQAYPSLELIDVTDAAGSTLGNGHSYFRSSPWVSSDILALLAYDLEPAERGLEKEDDSLVWKFPSNYIERLQRTLAGMDRE